VQNHFEEAPVHRVRGRLTYANVVATLALAIAVGGGTAFALKGKGTVTSYNVRNGNITGVDLSQIRLVSKPFTSTDAAADNNWTGASANIFCPRGYRLLTGGGTSPGGGNGRAALRLSQPNVDGGWTVSVQQDSGQTLQANITALCLKKKPGKPRLVH
jgi:hypothetical protein